MVVKTAPPVAWPSAGFPLYRDAGMHPHVVIALGGGKFFSKHHLSYSFPIVHSPGLRVAYLHTMAVPEQSPSEFLTWNGPTQKKRPAQETKLSSGQVAW